MQNISFRSLENLKELKKIIDEIKEKGNLLGIIVSYRDGNLVLENIGENFDCDTFTAMCASVIASAEALGYTIKNQKFNRIIVELHEKNMVIIGITLHLFIILFFNDQSKIDMILEHMDNYVNKIIQIQ